MGVLRKPCLLFRALVRWLVDCSANAACKCVGGKATTHALAHRGEQLYSQFSSNNHRGKSRGVASVVSLATTRARMRSMQQQQQ